MANDTLDSAKDLQRQVDSVNQSIQNTLRRISTLELDSSNTQLSKIPQGPGSGLNSDTIDGINASYKPQPNTLIPLGPKGKFPPSVIPTSSGGGSGFLLGNGAPTDKNILIADGTLWQSRTLSGDATISADTGTLTLTTVNSNVGTFGDSSHVSQITVDAKGRITAASNVAIPATSPGGSNTNVQFNDSNVFGGTSDLVFDKTNKRLGIGISSPRFALEIQSGDLLVQGNNIYASEPTISSNEKVLRFVHNGTVGVIATSETGGSLNPSPLIFYLNGAERARFDTSGHLGIGTTTNTTYPLQVIGNVDITGNLTSATWNGVKIGLAYGGTNADLSATGGTSQVLKQSSSGATITVGQLSFSDVSGTIATGQVSGSYTGITTIGILTGLTVNGASVFQSTIQVSGDTTGGGTTVGFGTNSPASTLTAPYTWLKFLSSDGSTVWVAAFK